MDSLIKIKKQSAGHNINSYEISGLNIFFPYDCFYDISYVPHYIMIKSIAKHYDIVVHIDAVSIMDNLNYIKLNKALTKLKRVKVNIDFFNGIFYDGILYDSLPSTLCRINASDIFFEDMVNAYMSECAMAIYMFSKGHADIDFVVKQSAGFIDHDSHIKSILQKAECVLVPQDDFYDFQLYAKSLSVENQLEEASAEVSSYIKGTDWFKANESKLVWDDELLCYVIAP